jgi:pimeloyl-ACP methyl ester carboxylesterase
MDMSYVELSAIPCRVLDHGGAGSPIVAVHGLGGYAENWSLIADSLTGLGRMVAIDLPGFGLSGPATTHDMKTHVGAVAALLGRLGGGPATIIGNSMGGLVAELLAVAHPHLVDRLVLIAPATPLPARHLPSDPMVTMRIATQAVPWLGPAMIRSFQRSFGPQAQVDETYRIVAHRPEALPPATRRRAIEIATLRRTMGWAARAFSESARSAGRTLLARSRFERMIDSIVQPTTLIWGTHDRVVTPESLRWLASRRPSWRSIELAAVGHVPMLECPDTVAQVIATDLVPA